VSLRAGDDAPLILDLGTGVRYLGHQLRAEGKPFVGAALLTHLHWDHVQGLPFFPPVLDPDTRLDIYAPTQEDGRTAGTALFEMIKPPMFPVDISGLPCTLAVHTVGDEEFNVGAFAVTARFIPHIGPTLGYRIEYAGHSVAYLPDHQQPVDGGFDINDAVAELVEGVDVLIHDSQYTTDEFRHRSTWGHCTGEYALHIARTFGVGTLVMFHHDPSRTDDDLESNLPLWAGVEGAPQVVLAREGSTLTLGG
jgi:phosphoribosyl 1,2-cyclic phosphodiesterase